MVKRTYKNFIRTKVSKSVFYRLEYDKSERAYFAVNWYDVSSHSGALKKTDVVFIGFDF